MPIVPDPSNFPSASKKGDESKNKLDEGEQRQKASANDHISKGPQIPDGEFMPSWSTAVKMLTPIQRCHPRLRRKRLNLGRKSLTKPKTWISESPELR